MKYRVGKPVPGPRPRFVQPNTTVGGAAYYYARKRRLERIAAVNNEGFVTEDSKHILTEDGKHLYTEDDQ